MNISKQCAADYGNLMGDPKSWIIMSAAAVDDLWRLIDYDVKVRHITGQLRRVQKEKQKAQTAMAQNMREMIELVAEVDQIERRELRKRSPEDQEEIKADAWLRLRGSGSIELTEYMTCEEPDDPDPKALYRKGPYAVAKRAVNTARKAYERQQTREGSRVSYDDEVAKLIPDESLTAEVEILSQLLDAMCDLEARGELPMSVAEACRVIEAACSSEKRTVSATEIAQLTGVERHKVGELLKIFNREAAREPGYRQLRHRTKAKQPSDDKQITRRVSETVFERLPLPAIDSAIERAGWQPAPNGQKVPSWIKQMPSAAASDEPARGACKNIDAQKLANEARRMKLLAKLNRIPSLRTQYDSASELSDGEIERALASYVRPKRARARKLRDEPRCPAIETAGLRASSQSSAVGVLT